MKTKSNVFGLKRDNTRIFQEKNSEKTDKITQHFALVECATFFTHHHQLSNFLCALLPKYHFTLLQGC
jgi:hypothetical protein